MFIEKYDIIIIGAGPAGLICGRTLALAHKKCLILEKKLNLHGKVCGDGISSRCVKVLEALNISPELLIRAGGHPVHYNIAIHPNTIHKSKDQENEASTEYGIGLSRDTLADILLEQAVKAGCEIRFGADGMEISHTDDGYFWGNAWGRDIVIAAGAAAGYKIHRLMGKGSHNLKYLPAGISSRVVANTDLSDDAFYFVFDSEEQFAGYSWAFPLGNRLWNIGSWSNEKAVNLKAQYSTFMKGFVAQNFNILSYDRVAKGGIIGAVPPNLEIEVNDLCIGDCAFCTDFITGEGISYAMISGYKRAIDLLQQD
ncbi:MULTISPECIES: NAD(P)/FAD-dependent oxidoreductase [unclassified Dehalobacter]|uniref:FAD-dependent monooxygenase n=1 Tax=unclassified Dehalobacter TaxID=2635733 RepID=UPI000E6BB3D6|nr:MULTISPECIES: NAD(P)/FAD-dependent oxidoreductase [unclassified Dehalobacter]RJE47189.1 geranylgeranyl reductase [Dehalobacter sp. MCB1]TCX53648.1 NAD(P)/FAD-dependent oxidoreductase [Dehalobacter sp. 14DCB1]TCX54951.1 NAD(P)/FAD-dependent oxidoreductase [Dehalobacter sp. 12DCB1]